MVGDDRAAESRLTELIAQNTSDVPSVSLLGLMARTVPILQ